ncbi:hypothetical protein CKO27_08525 [Thiocystis violacea]|nr:DUF1841 family protein [Thiocystis violacea]MBK1717683.1 hypothetical protein [Thiocystis violacea]
MFSADRQTHRRIFLEAWRKATNQEPLEPLEARIVEIMRQHPEYQAFIEGGEAALERDFLPDRGQANPFLHLGLHLAILEQLSIDQPRGIRQLYQDLIGRIGDPHRLEHAIMDCLMEALWRVQQHQEAFDERAYLDCVKRLGER